VRLALSALVVLLACALAGSAVPAAPAPILLGTTAPLTGDGSASASVAIGARAYLDWVSAHGGVGGRPVRLTVADDGSDPAAALAATRKLVEQGRVLAVVGQVGTESALATRELLDRSHVPQLFVASGAATFGAEGMRYPWTLGFRPSYEAEGWIYGRTLARTWRGARVGVLAESDELGRELLAGLRGGTARSTVSIAATQIVPTGAAVLASRLERLQAAGADVLAVFAGPALAARVLAEAERLAWRPTLLLASDAAVPGVAGSFGGDALSIGFVKDPLDPRWRTDPAMRLARSILARSAPGTRAGDPGAVYGMAIAWTTVALLRRAGPQPTREGLMAAARSLRLPGNPFLLPGITLTTSASDGFPVEQGQLRRYAAGRWRPLGGLWSYPDG